MSTVNGFNPEALMHLIRDQQDQDIESPILDQGRGLRATVRDVESWLLKYMQRQIADAPVHQSESLVRAFDLANLTI